MSMIAIVELQIKPDIIERVKPLFSALLIETWQSPALYDAYTRWRTERGDFERLSGLLERPLTRRFFRHVAV